MISIIIPVYNVEKYLNRCVDSVLAQTFSDFEIILVDDGSLDNGGKICDEYAEKYNQIHVIHKQNSGLSDARNTGIEWTFENSDSEWITFIDSDDWIHPKYLEVLYYAVKETGLSVSICGFERTDGYNPKVDITNLKTQICNTERFYCNKNANAIIACGKLYKKECFKEIRFPSGKLHEDQFVTYKILFQYSEIAVIDEPLYAYFTNQDGIMHRKWSPKRLSVFEALGYQLTFFNNKGYEKAYVEAIYIIAYIICGYIKQIGSDKDNIRYKKLLKKQLKVHLKKYKETAGFSLATTPGFYETAYPRMMYCYWLIRSILLKFHCGK